MTISISKRMAVLTLLVATSGCAATTFDSTWRNPEAQPGSFAGAKVLTVVQVADEGRRRTAEDILAADIVERGGQAVASYTLFPSITGLDTALAKAKAVEAGITGIVIMSFAGKERDVTTTVNVQPMYQSSMYYQQPWGAWYGGWYNPYPMETINVNTVVTVQTRVYSLRQNKLVWAGTSETLNPSSYADLINDLAQATAKELQSAGLLKKP